MSIKTVTCLISGEEIPKKKSIIVAGHRVKKEYKYIAESILINGAKVFAENWCSHSKSSINRTKALAMAICVIKQCKEIFYIDPMIFVVEIARLTNELNDEIPEAFIMKLFNYINGFEVHELKKKNVQYAIEKGFEIINKAYKGESE